MATAARRYLYYKHNVSIIIAHATPIFGNMMVRALSAPPSHSPFTASSLPFAGLPRASYRSHLMVMMRSVRREICEGERILMVIPSFDVC
jgi:hypothetical protein